MTVDLPVRRRVADVIRVGRVGRGSEHRPLARMFTAAASLLGVIAVLAIATGGIALWRLGESRTTLVDGASPALFAGQQLGNALVDQETGVRGFGLTGRPEFLEPFRNGLVQEQTAVARLHELAGVRGVDEFAPELDAVERAAEEWRAGYAAPVLADAMDAPGTRRGLVLFDRVRAMNQALVTDLEAHRLEARAAVNRAATVLAWTGAAIAAVVVSMLVAAGIGLRRAVLSPVSELAAQVRRVVSSDIQQPVRSNGPREIVELGEDVEAMRRHILADLAAAQVANERLDEQARDLERSNRDLEQFAYVASHDLQEPLRKVSSFCQLLQRRYGGQLDERADQYIEFAVDGAQRMSRLINDLLTFSRVGRSTDDFAAVDLGAVAAAAVGQLEAARAEVGGEFVLGELPVVHGDRALLHQLLVNLLANGLKFHREGVPPVVRVDAQRSDDAWEITVADNGIGIEAEYGDKVFVIFQRLHGRDVYPGTGIGLALAKKIVEFHDGRIGLDPSTGSGATIRFTLPAQEQETSP